MKRTPCGCAKILAGRLTGMERALMGGEGFGRVLMLEGDGDLVAADLARDVDLA